MILNRNPGRTRRKVLGLSVVGWLIAGFTGTALAVVGFIVLLGTAGTVSSAPHIDVIYASSGTPVAEPVAGNPTCGLVRNSATQATVTISNAMPGDRCRFQIRVQAQAGSLTTPRLQRFVLPEAWVTGNKLSYAIETCGLAVDPTTADAKWTLTVGSGFQPAETLTFTTATTGLEWRTTAQYNPAECISGPWS